MSSFTPTPPPSRLVLVCCHGIWLGGPSQGRDESEWLIADFQHGETPTFIEHIKAGLQHLARARRDSVLVFSGAATRRETRLSEARSYANVALENGYFGLLAPPVAGTDILLEERALDSYHNVLFGLTLFYARFRCWPRHVTVVSHAFKRPRLVDGHCVAVGFPLERVSFVGVDPPCSGAKPAAMMGVAEAVRDWGRDPHGKGHTLAAKRARRNAWAAWQGVFEEGVEDRDRGGLRTVGEGENETLVEGERRPW
ncbi:hypothetical protein ED733_003517 [Metarhizium rileyi]|uniref:DUF218 domain-containing protein n=1 Tax=Metarhizium rileyi (strain RCEF 4871) TaxID=1649241 RepID=A0A5C6G242_METRR|nr:hypothetical protein ED733_003517 [Metarhizium rileyi]